MGKHQTRAQKRASQQRHRQRGQPAPYPREGNWERVVLTGFDHLNGGSLIGGVMQIESERSWILGYQDADGIARDMAVFAAEHAMRAAFKARLAQLEDAYIASLPAEYFCHYCGHKHEGTCFDPP
jgi:hypothetical protein